jgi:hypothetical protein
LVNSLGVGKKIVKKYTSDFQNHVKIVYITFGG